MTGFDMHQKSCRRRRLQKRWGRPKPGCARLKPMFSHRGPCGRYPSHGCAQAGAWVGINLAYIFKTGFIQHFRAAVQQILHGNFIFPVGGVDVEQGYAPFVGLIFAQANFVADIGQSFAHAGNIHIPWACFG